MNNDRLKQKMQDFHLPAYQEIPDVGLYLEQVVKYINTFFTDFEEMQITSSMVSNYVKKKIISNPYKKTYNRDQIASLFFITTCKTVLSMDYLKIALSNLDRFESPQKAYEAFCTQLDQTLSTFFSDQEKKLEDPESTEVIALQNIVIAVSHKMYLEKYFSELQENTTETAK